MAFGGRIRGFLEMDARGFEAGLERARTRMDAFEKRTGLSGRRIAGFGTALTLGLSLPILASGAAALKASIDWEQAMTGVAKTLDDTGLSAAETEAFLAGLGDQFIDLSEKIPVSANELAKIAEISSQLGVARDHLLGFTRTMADLGVTTDLSAEEAAFAIAQFSNITGLAFTDVDRFGSAIVELGNRLATTESRVLDFGLRIAGAGDLAGLAEAEIVGIGAAMASLGVEAEAGGTATQKVLLSMTEAVASGGKELAVFASTADMAVGDFSDLFRRDAAEAFTRFVEGLGAQGDRAFKTLEALGLQDQRLLRGFLALANAGDLLRRSVDLGTNAFEENVALTKEAERFYATLGNRLRTLRNEFVNTAVELGNRLRPAFEVLLETGIKPLLGFLRRLVERFGELDPKLQAVVIGLAGLLVTLGPVVTGLGFVMIALGGLLTGAGAVLGVAAGLSAAITALAAGATIAARELGLLDDAARLVRRGFNDAKRVASELWTNLLDLKRGAATVFGPMVEDVRDLIDVAGELAEAIGDVAQAIRDIPPFEIKIPSVPEVVRRGGSLAARAALGDQIVDFVEDAVETGRIERAYQDELLASLENAVESGAFQTRGSGIVGDAIQRFVEAAISGGRFRARATRLGRTAEPEPFRAPEVERPERPKTPLEERAAPPGGGGEIPAGDEDKDRAKAIRSAIEAFREEERVIDALAAAHAAAGIEFDALAARADNARNLFEALSAAGLDASFKVDALGMSLGEVGEAALTAAEAAAVREATREYDDAVADTERLAAAHRALGLDFDLASARSTDLLSFLDALSAAGLESEDVVERLGGRLGDLEARATEGALLAEMFEDHRRSLESLRGPFGEFDREMNRLSALYGAGLIAGGEFAAGQQRAGDALRASLPGAAEEAAWEAYRAAIERVDAALEEGIVTEERAAELRQRATQGLLDVISPIEQELKRIGVRAGTELVQGLIDGSLSMGDFLRRTIAMIANVFVMDVFEGIFGISSPSTLAIGWGEDIVRGLAAGLERAGPLAAGAAVRVSEGVSAALGDFSAAAPETEIAMPRGLESEVSTVPAAGFGRAAAVGASEARGGNSYQFSFEIRAQDATDVRRFLDANGPAITQRVVDEIERSEGLRRRLAPTRA